jgi:hypothetical protein
MKISTIKLCVLALGAGVLFCSTAHAFNEGVSSDDLLYYVKPDGTMWWQTDTITSQPSTEHGKYFTAQVTNKLGTAVQVSDGWLTNTQIDGKPIYKDILPGDASTMYVLWNGGALIWCRHDGYLNGTKEWKNEAGGIGGDNQKATDWNQYDKVVPMGNGVLYTLSKNGTLRWNRHTSYKTGGGYLQEWAQPVDVMTGWNQYKMIIGGSNGVFYVVTEDGKLLWYRHTFLNPIAIPLGADNSMVGMAQKVAWGKTWQGPKEIGSGGWGDFAKIFCAGNGHIYAITPEGQLKFWDHTGWQNGATTWGFGEAKDHVIADGWKDYAFAFAAMPG